MPLPLAFSDGVSLGPGRCRVIAELATEDLPEPDRGFQACSVVLEIVDSKIVDVVRLNCTAPRIAVLPGPEVFVSGHLGFVARLGAGRFDEEKIDGPSAHGYVCDLRAIGSHLYAAGMGRQVYRRSDGGRWAPIHEGVLNVPADILDVTGFESIDGPSEDDLYAVGFHGEIWNYNGRVWREIPGPTNLILERVRSAGPDRVYACGQMGVLLRGHAESWDIVPHDSTEENFWGMEWFRDRLYVATQSQIFVLTDAGNLSPVDLGLPGERSFSQLHAGAGALWSFGDRHLAWTADGIQWTDVTL
jgi:hypothetical protein